MRTLLPLLLLLGAAVAAPPAAAQDGVTIYRCTDAQGQLALQDFPCADDQQQQVRTMARPQDPAPRPGADAAAPVNSQLTPAAEHPVVEVVVRTPPRPMYECITPDGKRYTSDSGDGNPRPAPVWHWAAPLAGPGPGVPPGPRSGADRRGAGIASPGMSTSPGPSLTTPSRGRPAPPPPPPRPHPPGHPYPPIYGYPASDGLIRDACHRLPQGQVCGLLGDRRTEIRRRMFNAQPTERAALREEERGITARLNEDCNIR